MAIAVVDYCKGNLRSVEKGIQAAGFEAFITEDPDRIAQADAIVLPGVGSFADASKTMLETGQMEVIRRRVLDDKIPFLGICLGLQLLLDRGNEDCEPGTWAEGLGIIAGEAVRMADTCPDGSRVKIPHVGWNSIECEACAANPLFEGVEEGSYFYFTHSYCAQVSDNAVVTSFTSHALPFVSSVCAGNVFGVQFHPEKSSDGGLVILRNFGRLTQRGGE